MKAGWCGNGSDGCATALRNRAAEVGGILRKPGSGLRTHGLVSGRAEIQQM